MAGPIFKEVADKVYASSIGIHKEINEEIATQNVSVAPLTKGGSQKDLQLVLKSLGIPVTGNSKNDWVTTSSKKNSVDLKGKNFRSDVLPSVVGLAVEDAIFLLENMGLEVLVKGKGTVKSQSITEGEKVIAGNKIILELS